MTLNLKTSFPIADLHSTALIVHLGSKILVYNPAMKHSDGSAGSWQATGLNPARRSLLLLLAVVEVFEIQGRNDRRTDSV